MTDMMPRVTTPQPHHYRDWKSWAAALTVSLMDQEYQWEGMAGEQEEEREKFEQRTTTLEVEVGDARGTKPSLLARVTEIEEARIEGDRALAERTDTLEVTVNTPTTGLSAKVTRIDSTVGDADTGLVKASNDLSLEVSNARVGQPTLLARLSEINEARIEGDRSTAVAGLSVDAVANLATASGAIEIAATAGPHPAGVSAEYAWRLRAGSVVTGMRAIAKADGTSAIAFTSGGFSLTDPGLNAGAPTHVFNYVSGNFEFNVPVKFNGSVIYQGTVRTLQLEPNAVHNYALENAREDGVLLVSGLTSFTWAWSVWVGLQDTSGNPLNAEIIVPENQTPVDIILDRLRMRLAVTQRSGTVEGEIRVQFRVMAGATVLGKFPRANNPDPDEFYFFARTFSTATEFYEVSLQESFLTILDAGTHDLTVQFRYASNTELGSGVGQNGGKFIALARKR